MRKRLPRALLAGALFLAAGLAVFYSQENRLSRALLRRALLQHGCRSAAIGKVDLSLRAHQLAAFGVSAAASFPDGAQLTLVIPAARIQWEASPFHSPRLRCKSIDLTLAEADLTGSFLPSRTPGQTPVATPASLKGDGRFREIERISLTLGKIRLHPAKDGSAQLFDFGGEQRSLDHVTSWQQVQDWLIGLLLERGVQLPIGG